ncbi:hypothetical protein [Sporolactobacillus laevolacticus]|uniref:hypothetical protein n=1 Tax=Sporolactobacillus laevolacticus TaxID=33018 RepID=UPI0025B50453|nr:hypothetical protein [Sporolactobacillus laevolacticus]MDN3956166.1 hypothetical protein [Sporolactobacillus laevolacticus]
MIDLTINQVILEKHKEFILGENRKKERRLYRKLEKAVSESRSKIEREILLFLLKNIEIIVIGNIYQLDKTRKKFDDYLKMLPSNDQEMIKEKQELYKKLDIFIKEYTYFYRSPGWNAYEFQKVLGITVCPYCNSNFIYLYKSKSGQTRATLDHFFDKGTYPFLGYIAIE